jgi:flagellar basal-body rod protein FlgF
MESPGLIALSRQEALQRQMDVIANNIANASTTGFKQQKMLFEEYMTGADASGDKLGFVREKATWRDSGDGPLKKTSNTLDVALEGNGYFTVSTPNGNRYTRDGSFSMNEQRELVDQNGYPVLDTSGRPIQFPADATTITINTDQSVSTDQGTIGNLQIVKFERDQDLQPEGRGLYATDAAPIPTKEAKTHQGMLEQSNVQPILEMTSMIDVLRQYQSTQNLLNNEHDRIRSAIQRIGKVA